MCLWKLIIFFIWDFVFQDCKEQNKFFFFRYQFQLFQVGSYVMQILDNLTLKESSFAFLVHLKIFWKRGISKRVFTLLDF